MQKGLRAVFGGKKVKLLSFTPTSSNEQSGLVEYQELDKDGAILNEGVAQIFNCADQIEYDDDMCLTGNSHLSATGEFISVRTAFDRTGLGRKR